MPSAWSLLPPAVAIGLALATRRVPLSLTAGILTGAVVLAGGNPLIGAAGAVRATLDVVAAPSNARLLLFALLIGPLVATMQASRGVDGLVGRLETRGLVRGPRGARLLAWLIGIIIFIESNITLLITGAVARPLFDRYREPRERLAYIADCTSAPVCILIPFNAWGALILGLLAAQQTPRQAPRAATRYCGVRIQVAHKTVPAYDPMNRGYPPSSGVHFLEVLPLGRVFGTLTGAIVNPPKWS